MNIQEAGAATTNTNAPTKRARRTPEQTQAARVEREAKLLDKQRARAERLKREAEAAEKRAAEIAERKTKIETNVPVAKEQKEVPKIGETRAERIQRDLKKVLKELGQKHGVNFGELTPRLTQQGQALSLRLVAHVAELNGTAKPKAAGMTREGARFLENAKLIGIRPGLLGKEVQLAGDDATYKVAGLKGRAHDVVLQNVKVEGADGIKTVPADEFKTKMVLA